MKRGGLVWVDADIHRILFQLRTLAANDVVLRINPANRKLRRPGERDLRERSARERHPYKLDMRGALAGGLELPLSDTPGMILQPALPTYQLVCQSRAGMYFQYYSAWTGAGRQCVCDTRVMVSVKISE
jgi:hypothetical protein